MYKNNLGKLISFISEGEIKKTIEILLQDSKGDMGLRLELVLLLNRYNRNEKDKNFGTINFEEFSRESNQIVKALISYIELNTVERKQINESIIKVNETITETLQVFFVVNKKGTKNLIEVNSVIPTKFLIKDLLRTFDGQDIIELLEEDNHIDAYLVSLDTDELLTPEKSLIENGINSGDSLSIKLKLKNDLFIKC